MKRPWEDLAPPLPQAVRYIGPGGRGGSHPLIVQIDTGEYVHLKLKKNPQGTRTLVNDWLCTQLGQALNLPVPDPLLVRLQFSDLTLFPVLRGRRWSPGLQFGTRYLADSMSLTTLASTTSLVNSDDIPAILLFEWWIDNHDLKGSHIRLSPCNHHWRAVFTDHGFAFGGPSWSQSSLHQYRHRGPNILPLAKRLVGLAPALEAWDTADSRFHEVSYRDLISLFESVPGEWGRLDSSQHQALADFLLRRRDMLSRRSQAFKRQWQSLIA